MRMKIRFEFETLFSNQNCEVTRFKVIGGWIVHTTMSDKNKLSTTQCFVPDSEHGWRHVVEPEKECPILE